MVSNWAQYKDAHDNMKRPSSKVGYFSKIEETFSTALTAQSAQQKGTRFISVFIVLLGYIILASSFIFFLFRMHSIFRIPNIKVVYIWFQNLQLTVGLPYLSQAEKKYYNDNYIFSKTIMITHDHFQ